MESPAYRDAVRTISDAAAELELLEERPRRIMLSDETAARFDVPRSAEATEVMRGVSEMSAKPAFEVEGLLGAESGQLLRAVRDTAGAQLGRPTPRYVRHRSARSRRKLFGVMRSVPARYIRFTSGSDPTTRTGCQAGRRLPRNP